MTIHKIKKRYFYKFMLLVFASFLLSVFFFIWKYFHQDYEKKEITIKNNVEKIKLLNSEEERIKKIIANNESIFKQYKEREKRYFLDSKEISKKINYIFSELKKEYTFLGDFQIKYFAHESFINAVQVEIEVAGPFVSSPELQEQAQEKSSMLLFAFIRSIENKLMIYPSSLKREGNHISFIIYKA